MICVAKTHHCAAGMSHACNMLRRSVVTGCRPAIPDDRLFRPSLRISGSTAAMCSSCRYRGLGSCTVFAFLKKQKVFHLLPQQEWAPMRIAMPIHGSYVSTVFDFADRLLLVDIANNQTLKEDETFFPQTLPSIRVGKLRELGVNTLICGAISNALAAMIWHSGINLVSGITGEARQILDAYMKGQLYRPQYLLPGFGPTGRCGWWRGGGRRFRGGRGTR